MELTENALAVLKKRYFKKDEKGEVIEDACGMLTRVSENIAHGDEKNAQRYYEIMDNLYFLPNSPTLMNAGNDLQQLSACFVLPIEDSMESIFTAVKNAALIHKSGGGTGFSFSKLRERNARVRTTMGVSSGPITFMKVFNAATDAVKQGGTRRGANMAILNVDHPDILDFITAKEETHELTNFNISVGITEEFMNAVIQKKEFNLISPHSKRVVRNLAAEDIFNLIVEMAHKNGEPGIVFVDRLDKFNPTPNVGKIEATNPCITGDTLVLTENGYQKIEDLVGKDIKIYVDLRAENGKGIKLATPTEIIFTGEKEVIELKTKKGLRIKVTPNHKILTKTGWKSASEISRDDTIFVYNGNIDFTENKNEINLLKSKNYYSENFTDKIISMKKLGIEKVYDIKNIETHSFIANGFVVHNCGEQPLLPNEACNLGSINLALMVQEHEINWDLIRETVYTAVDFLDDVIDCSAFPLPEIQKMAYANRKIGLGVMGWADMLVQLGIPYNSDEAISLAQEVMEFIDYHSKVASMQRAQKYGSFPNFQGSIYSEGKLQRTSIQQDWATLIKDIQKYGIRNATTTTIAPTGTISMIADASSGVEPLFSLVYVKKVLEGEKLLYVNKYFEKLAQEEDFYSKELMEEISEKASLLDIKGIPEDVKMIFVTSHDISPDWHIKMQSSFQKYVDNAVSKTINFPHDASKEDICTAYELASELGCKGVTVYRYGSREEQVLNIGKKLREQEKGRVAPRSRPDITRGVTRRIDTGCGHLYVTINTDERGVCEVFTQMGKVGGCASAQLEAIARLISLALRSNVKLESIIKQLRSIRCPSPIWTKGEMILSCADGIAKALEEFIAGDGNGQEDRQLPLTTPPPSPNQRSSLSKGIGAICPECGSAIEFKEGCKTCPVCGWSKCS
jgi:ribonucleotide reductase alpha subunit